MNKRGFTLIELLAVIVILGILLAVAIPAVSQYITRSRKDSLVSEAKLYIESVRDDITAEMYPAPIGQNEATIITLDKIKLEKKSDNKSPFGGKYLYNKSYVVVVNVGEGNEPEYKYYIALQDSKDYAIPLTSEEELTRDKVVAKAKNKMEVTIQALCGNSEGVTSSYAGLSGLDKSVGNVTATVFSTDKCGKGND
jgi:type IV pilus assembly protein PilA